MRLTLDSTNQDVVKEIEAIKDLRNRVKLSSKYLPSVVTYTLHNTVNTYYLHEVWSLSYAVA